VCVRVCLKESASFTNIRISLYVNLCTNAVLHVHRYDVCIYTLRTSE